MSNDNKTMADVQPGGRVRLGDQAERAQWRSMDTCPRDGTVVRLRWGEDHVSPGWWSAPVSPVQNDDGTWPSDTGGFPWAFIDFNNGSAFVNHAVDTEYGPTHWAPYAALSAQPSPSKQPAHCPVKHCGMTYARVPADGRCHACGATVQPSRGGQGDARIPFETWAKDGGFDVSKFKGIYNSLETRAAWEAWLYWQRLAARQPVGEPVGYVSRDTLERLPIEGSGRIDARKHPAELRTIPLYAAPPAQAVDLGQFVPDPKTVPDCFAEDDSDAQYNSGWNDCRDAVLALIDSHTVGNK